MQLLSNLSIFDSFIALTRFGKVPDIIYGIFEALKSVPLALCIWYLVENNLFLPRIHVAIVQKYNELCVHLVMPEAVFFHTAIQLTTIAI